MAFVQKLATTPVTKVEIRVKCFGLKNKDLTSKSDPCCVLFQKSQSSWVEVGRTERIQNSLNPEFTTPFTIDYCFEQVQNLRFDIYDLDNTTKDLSDDDHLGHLDITLGQVVASKHTKKPLHNKKEKDTTGTIELEAEEVGKVNEVLEVSFEAYKLDKKDTFSKSDPYLQFCKHMPDGTWQVVHRTEVINNTLNPTWAPFSLKLQALCGGDLDKDIKVDCFDHDDDGSHDLIGSFTTTANTMLKAQSAKVDFPCINPKMKDKKKYTNSGVVVLTKCKLTKEYTFLDYVLGGMQINFTVGIDFTGSNGDPRSSDSLHFINAYQPNEYMTAIAAVGNVIQDYDSDRMFPVLGFGAKIPPHFQVSHEFAVNFQANNPFCAGIAGILEAYKACVAQVQLFGPTNFSPIIYHVAKFADVSRQKEGAQNYYVLLILTDGIITDMDETKAALVYAAHLPMSVIIVGVGNADFSAMNELDGDDGVLKTATGEKVCRDIVQFVPFSKLRQNPNIAELLAKQVLAEVPNQVCAYYKKMGISPSVKQAQK